MVMAATQNPLENTRSFTADEVARMVEVGILGEDEPLELIEGKLVLVTPQGPPHSGLTTLLLRRLLALYSESFSVRAGCPLEVGGQSLPEPDLAVAAVADSDLLTRHPRGDEAVLVIEVARTSHAMDRLKAGIYARAGVPVYWLVDVPAKRIEVHEAPQPDGRYGLVRMAFETDTVSPPGTAAHWRVCDLLP